jgi:2-polyprenyl-6-methoxyphenol hydroxylase-like FAD-dependent oxidoreductase
VRELRFDGDRVIGIAGTTAIGRAQVERARLVIGADGRNSFVASTVRAPKYRAMPPITCWYYTYWPDVQDLGHVSGARGRRHLIFLPTHGGLTCVLVGWPADEFGRVRANVAAEYREAVSIVSPTIAEHLEGNAPAERFYGIADVPNFFRKPYGSGWALVGDAGHHRDPVGAHGISDAVRDASVLAEKVHAAFLDDKAMEQALGEYEQRRNEAAFPLYDQNCRIAAFVPPSADELRIRAALRMANQEDVNAYLAARYGTRPRESFYNQENLARIFKEAEAAPSSPSWEVS